MNSDQEEYYKDFIVSEMNGFEIKFELPEKYRSVKAKLNPNYKGTQDFFSLTQKQVNVFVENGIKFIDCRPYRFFPGIESWKNKKIFFKDAPIDYKGIDIQCSYTYLSNEPKPLKNISIYSNLLRLEDTKFLEDWENVNINTYCFSISNKFLTEIINSHHWPLSYGISYDTPKGDNISSNGVDIKTNYIIVPETSVFKNIDILDMPKICDNIFEYLTGIKLNKEILFYGSVGNFTPKKKEHLLLIYNFRLCPKWTKKKFIEISRDNNMILGTFKGTLNEINTIFDYT